MRQNVPGDDPLPGPGATSECLNSRTAGPKACPGQVLHNTTTGPSRLQLAGNPRAHSAAARTHRKLSSTNRSSSSGTYLHEQHRSNNDLLQFSALLPSQTLGCTVTHPRFRRCTLHLAFLSCRCALSIRLRPFSFVSVCALHSACPNSTAGFSLGPTPRVRPAPGAPWPQHRPAAAASPLTSTSHPHTGPAPAGRNLPLPVGARPGPSHHDPSAPLVREPRLHTWTRPGPPPSHQGQAPWSRYSDRPLPHPL